MSKIITLTVADAELCFEPTLTAYNGYINDLMPADKVAPSHNYLKRIVSTQSKAALDELLARPGAALQLATAINAQFAPTLDITVKN
jgi:hypothetical protein